MAVDAHAAVRGELIMTVVLYCGAVTCAWGAVVGGRHRRGDNTLAAHRAARAPTLVALMMHCWKHVS